MRLNAIHPGRRLPVVLERGIGFSMIEIDSFVVAKCLLGYRYVQDIGATTFLKFRHEEKRIVAKNTFQLCVVWNHHLKST